jgi:hypothetical protein
MARNRRRSGDIGAGSEKVEKSGAVSRYRSKLLLLFCLSLNVATAPKTANASEQTVPTDSASPSCKFYIKVDPKFESRVDGPYGRDDPSVMSAGMLELFQKGGRSAYIAASTKALSTESQMTAAGMLVAASPRPANVIKFEGSEKEFTSLLQTLDNSGRPCVVAVSISELAVASSATWIGLEGRFLYYDNVGSFTKPFKKYNIVRLNLSKKNTVEPLAYENDLSQNLTSIVALFYMDVQQKRKR